MIGCRPFATAWVVVAATALWPGPEARAEEISDIVWGDGGRYTRSVSIASGEFAETCGALDAGASVRWRFGADQPLDFKAGPTREGEQCEPCVSSAGSHPTLSVGVSAPLLGRCH